MLIMSATFRRHVVRHDIYRQFPAICRHLPTQWSGRQKFQAILVSAARFLRASTTQSTPLNNNNHNNNNIKQQYHRPQEDVDVDICFRYRLSFNALPLASPLGRRKRERQARGRRRKHSRRRRRGARRASPTNPLPSRLTLRLARTPSER